MSIILLCASLLLSAILITLTIVIKPKQKMTVDKDKGDNDKVFYVITKILSVLIFGLFIYRILSPEVFERIQNRNGLFAPSFVVIMAIIRAMFMGASCLIILSPWFKYKSYQLAVATFGTLTFIVNALLYTQNVQAILGNVSVPTYSAREIMYAIHLVLGLTSGILYFYKLARDKATEKLPLTLLFAFLLFIGFSVAVANPYTYINLFDIKMKEHNALSFNRTHVLLLLVSFVITLILAVLFRNVKDKKILHCFLASMSLICVFDYIYGREFIYWSNTKLPLHICNTGVFLMFISFTVKSKPIFYFNYLVNIVGALFAMLLPDMEVHILSHNGIHYWVNHIVLFMLPIVAVAGGFYERPKMNFVFYSMLVFTFYFILVAILDAVWQDKVNYFFLNGDSIVDRFTWAPRLKYDFVLNFTWLGYEFRVYWLYWILVYVIYLGFILVAWFVFATFYQVSDGYADLINRTKQKMKEHRFLKKEMGGRSITEPLHPENKGKVVISHFSKIYPGQTTKSVDDFSITIQPGTVYGFLGHNGAGKSTTIKSLVGIQTITEGTMEIEGYDLVRQPLEAKMQIGYVSDNHTVYDHLTGREYINYVADLYLVNEKDRDERIEKYAKMFAMEDAIDREIKGYSHGMKQKIVVIGSLIHQPKVWVLDEPLTGLDPTSSHQIKTIMKEYAEQGNIVFFSSHVIEVVEKICDEICIIGQGKLLGTWKIKELSKQGLTLQDLYIKYVSYGGEHA